LPGLTSVTGRAGRELNSGNIWQRNYYEHIIRDEADHERIVGYIRDTPLRGAYPVNWDQDEENPQTLARSGNDPE
jgi:putative transposase